MTSTTPFSTVDVRSIVPRERHPLIFSTFKALAEGQAMELVNDHDPKPLHDQFQAEMPGCFRWDTLESGPDVWRIGITRLGVAHADGSCCGHCGGA